MVDLRTTLQSESQITVEWTQPASDGGCPIEGYRAYLEDIESPGYTIVYNGIKQPYVVSFTLSQPTIQAGKYYNIKVVSKNCGLFSEEQVLAVASGSVAG